MAALARQIFLSMCLLSPCLSLATEEEDARAWLAWYDSRVQEVYHEDILNKWKYSTNITDYNQQLVIESGLRRSLFRKEAGLNTTQFDWRHFQSDDLRRLFDRMASIGSDRLEEAEIARYDKLLTGMQRIYSMGEVCLQPNDCLALDPGLTRFLMTSRDYDELQKVWVDWRDATGRRMRNTYEEFVTLRNKAARLGGYEDAGDSWRSSYEVDNFEADVLRLWEEVAPLYRHLHAYTRRKLQAVYSDHPFPSSGHIPGHLLSNMWAHTWSGISDILLPFPNSSSIDITQALIDQGYDVLRIVRLAESFYVSLGLDPMPDTFWQNSMFERPEDRDVVCHASAWDFSNRKDFRIKQCTDITADWLYTTHHEMGHIHYYMQYKDLPFLYHGGANPGFHEAVGDVIALSVMTPEHLHEVGLLDAVEESEESDLNFLMQQALEKVAFLPFGYLIDQWRWDVFSGDTPPSNYNEHWWKYRCQYQGVSPPVTRSEEDFDAGSKYHIPHNTPYIRYFVSFMLQFQLHQTFCNTSGNTRPLHRCDIYNSRAAGHQLRDILRLGASVPWPEVLQQTTGRDTLSADALLEYFQPLYEWLVRENEGHPIGWDEDCPIGLIIASGSTHQMSLSVSYITLHCIALVFVKQVLL